MLPWRQMRRPGRGHVERVRGRRCGLRRLHARRFLLQGLVRAKADGVWSRHMRGPLRGRPLPQWREPLWLRHRRTGVSGLPELHARGRRRRDVRPHADVRLDELQRLLRGQRLRAGDSGKRVRSRRHRLPILHRWDVVRGQHRQLPASSLLHRSELRNVLQRKPVHAGDRRPRVRRAEQRMCRLHDARERVRKPAVRCGVLGVDVLGLLRRELVRGREPGFRVRARGRCVHQLHGGSCDLRGRRPLRFVVRNEAHAVNGG